MSNYILNINDAAGADVAEVGLLALDMARLRAANIPTPDSFCLTASAYSHRAETLGLPAVERKLWEYDPNDTRLAEATEEAEELLRTKGIDDELKFALSEASSSLSSALISVVLSPVIASYDAAAIAGLIWSVDYIPPDAAPDAVAEAWGALWTQRSFAFRKRAGIVPGSEAFWGAAVLIATANPAPLQGRIHYLGKDAADDEEAWIISADPRVRGERELSDEPREKGQPPSPLTGIQAEALRILAEGAAEILGEPRTLSWSFDGNRFTITGLPYG